MNQACKPGGYNQEASFVQFHAFRDVEIYAESQTDAKYGYDLK